MSPDAISPVVVADKLEQLGRMRDGIRSLPLESLEAFTADPRMVAAGDSYLRRALEALLDLARHLLAKGFGRAPAEYAEVGKQLGEVGILDAALAAKLIVMARYRNRMVHFYSEISESELYRILSAQSNDVDDVVVAIKMWLNAHPERIATS
jgi:uncharacterized protein YutE (UPF0331/DUF86 family)